MVNDKNKSWQTVYIFYVYNGVYVSRYVLYFLPRVKLKCHGNKAKTCALTFVEKFQTLNEIEQSDELVNLANKF